MCLYYVCGCVGGAGAGLARANTPGSEVIDNDKFDSGTMGTMGIGAAVLGADDETGNEGSEGVELAGAGVISDTPGLLPGSESAPLDVVTEGGGTRIKAGLNIGNPGMAFCYEHSNVRNRPQSDKKNER
jgi:hypothetical protein